ncbi:hypothetical protein [Streptomyces sp. NBC_01378]|uniref:hypothetical protein n=1 Tax=Streptomyces sp. NBC_01378 TaxID=2903844 RepID=UPI00386F6014
MRLKREFRRSWQPRHALLALPLCLIAVVTVVDTLAPPDVHLGPLLVAAPAVTAAIGGARLVAAVGALAVVAQLVIGVARPGWPLTLNHEMQILSLAIVTAVIATFCYLRERRQRELAQVRSVSEAAQRVVLRPLPSRLGPLKVACGCRKGLPSWSGCMVVFVERSAEAVASAYVQVGDLARIGDRLGV